MKEKRKKKKNITRKTTLWNVLSSLWLFLCAFPYRNHSINY